MEYIADLHTHSKYAGACSERLELEALDVAAKRKGIGIIGTGDFTHPLWFKDIQSKLVEAEPGLFRLKDSNTGTRFVLSTEVSTIFNNDGGTSRGVFDKSVKKVHILLYAPSIEVVSQINAELTKFGSLQIDGRPQLSMRASELAETVKRVSEDVLIACAHVWTPWFGVFGAFSGFDSIKEAFEDQEKHISALETGLSSDPAMNWRISKNDKYTLISGSDAHSLPKLGREATVFEFEEKDLSYKALAESINNKRVKLNVEFFPEEGKYHYDGHRNCGVSLSPAQARKYNNICPVCRKGLTIGVLHRVDDLADRDEGYVPKNATPFVHAIPLEEIIAYVSNKGQATAYVKNAYDKLVDKFGSEFNVLLKASVEQISTVDPEVAEAIGRIRADNVNVIPGYDGVFGVIDIMGRVKPPKQGMQRTLSD